MKVDGAYLKTLRSTLDAYSVIFGTPSPIISPFASYRAYVKRVKESNLRFNRSVRASLSDNEFPQMALIITGSNGRAEGNPSSPVEYIVVGDLPDIDSIVGLEAKDIGNSSMACYMNDGDRVFPGRILDSFHVAGDESYLVRAKQKLLEEMKDTRIRERVKDKRRESAKIMETGVQRFRGTPIRHFNLERGYAYYGDTQTDGNGGKPASFKYGPLRYVQFRVLEEVCNLAVSGGAASVIDMPSNTSERLKWLHDKGLFKSRSSDLDKVVDAYGYFLWLYHMSQHLHKNNGTAQITFDIDEVEDRIRNLFSL